MIKSRVRVEERRTRVSHFSPPFHRRRGRAAADVAAAAGAGAAVPAVPAGEGGDPAQPRRLVREVLPCGRLLATASSTARSRCSPRRRSPPSPPAGHADGVSDISWSTDSFYLCSASDDRTLRIWDVRPVLAGLNPGSGGGGGGAQPADPNADRCIRVLKGHTNFVFSANFNPQTNSTVASGGFDCTVRIWDVKSGRCVRAIDAHSEPVTSVHFIRDGSIIVSGSHDGTCKIWDAGTGSCLKTVIDEKKPAVSFSMFSPNGKFILVAALDDTLV